MKIKGIDVTDGQAAVYGVLKEHGPLADHALVPLAQHMSGVRQSSSSIRSRRKELVDLQLVGPTGTSTVTGSNRSAKIYKVA